MRRNRAFHEGNALQFLHQSNKAFSGWCDQAESVRNYPLALPSSATSSAVISSMSSIG